MSEFLDATKKVLDGISNEAEKAKDAVTPQQGLPPKIESEEQADRIVKLLMDLEAEKDRVAEAAALKIGRLQDRIDGLNYLWQAALREWAREKIGDPAKARRKSVVLDNGVLGFRNSPPKVVTESEAELIKWAEVNCVDAVTYHPRVSVTKVSEWEAKQNKLAPGRRAVEAEEKFYIKPPKGKESDE